MVGYEIRKRRLLDAIARAGSGVRPGLSKPTSNLFRDRARANVPRIDLAHFNEVLRVDPAAGTVCAEGMTTFEALADATLAQGTMPCVVPQLKSITLGGALVGVGIEATSFRHGLVHHMVTEVDVLTADGRILTCTPDNEHRDLFHGLPNSYGTLGYALRVTARTIPVKPFVRIEHRRYADPVSCFAAIADLAARPDLDFLDGVVFAPDALYLTLGQFVDAAPYYSDYTLERIYYRSIAEREQDYMRTRDFLWRWDTDWFWCSRNVGAQHPWVRRLLGRRHLNSVTYQKLMRWSGRWNLSAAWDRLRGLSAESVIQDVDIPIDRAAEFLDFLHAEVGILPIWICPIRAPATPAPFALYPLDPARLYVNFGFWDRVRSSNALPTGFRNRMIERKVGDLKGLKSLYSDSYYSESEFWNAYDAATYAALKREYDPRALLPGLYQKCVLGHR